MKRWIPLLFLVSVSIGMNRPGQTGPAGSGPPPPVQFGAHPRLFLTAAKKAELIARKNASSTEYTELKNLAATYPPPTTVNAELTQPVGPADLTISVTNGSGFPTGPFQIHIDTELIKVASRNGNTLNVSERGAMLDEWPVYKTQAAEHPAGATAWKHEGNFNFLPSAPVYALLDQLGVSGYETGARAAASYAFLYVWTVQDGPAFQPNNALNYARWGWPYAALAYDWQYARLTTHEKKYYADLLGRHANWSVSNFYANNSEIHRQREYENGITNNIANGQVRAVLMEATASYGDQPDAQRQWDWAYEKVARYILPSLIDGPYSGGNTGEGTEYSAETDEQIPDMLDVIASVGIDHWPLVKEWSENFAKFKIHSATPGSSKSAQTTTGSGSAERNILTVTSNADFVRGQQVLISLDGPPYQLDMTIVDISGNTWTLSDPLPVAVSGKPVAHRSKTFVYGDNENGPNYDNPVFTDGHVSSAEHVLAHLKATNPTLAGQLRWWLDNVAPPHALWQYSRQKFMWYDPAIRAIDYRSALSTDHLAQKPDSTGLLMSRSDWTPMATWVHLTVGGEIWDHIHSSVNSYGIWRKGVWLTKELSGYGAYGTPFFGNLPMEQPWVGARAHNTVLMNNHGAASGWGPNVTGPEQNQLPGAAKVERSEIGTGYAYMRGNGSGRYRADWVVFSQYATPKTYYPNNDAQEFIRDFLYLKPDLIVFADRLGYAHATASPTDWIAQFPTNPTITGQRIMATNANQQVIQDIVVPAGAEMTVNNHHDNQATFKGFWVDTKSGATAAAEWTLQTIQCTDVGMTPLQVTRLTTTNANVAQVGQNYVVGASKDDATRLPISYSYTGNPAHYLMGLQPSTRYHIAKSGGLVTITVGGAGDPTSTPAGLLIF